MINNLEAAKAIWTLATPVQRIAWIENLLAAETTAFTDVELGSFIAWIG